MKADNRPQVVEQPDYKRKNNEQHVGERVKTDQNVEEKVGSFKEACRRPAIRP